MSDKKDDVGGRFVVVPVVMLGCAPCTPDPNSSTPSSGRSKSSARRSVSAWDDAKARAGCGRHDADVELLTRLIDDHWHELQEWEGNAFTDMFDALEAGQGELTDKQRSRVREAAERVGATIEYENLISTGQVPRGREVEMLVKDKPLRPPTRKPSE
jgi:hypothetical protein